MLSVKFDLCCTFVQEYTINCLQHKKSLNDDKCEAKRNEITELDCNQTTYVSTTQEACSSYSHHFLLSFFSPPLLSLPPVNWLLYWVTTYHDVSKTHAIEWQRPWRLTLH